MRPPVLLTVGLSRSNFMLSDGKTTDFLDSCSIPFPFLLLHFSLSYSFLLVTKENLYHPLTILGYKFSCIFSTLSSQLLCLSPFHFLNPDAFSITVCIQSFYSYIKLVLD